MKRRLLSRILSFCMVFVFVFGTSGVSVLAETAGEALNTDEIAVDMSVEAEEDGLIRPNNLSIEEKEGLKKDYEKNEEALNYVDYGINNEYLEVSVDSDNGKFTIGNVAGNPNYTTDDNQKLLFGHPSPWSSETLIKVDGGEFFFNADSVVVDNDSKIVRAYMDISSYQVRVEQILEFAKSGSTNINDMVKISYKVYNLGNSTKAVGIRIMMDTMIANNDWAPFKVAGVGNVTTRKSFTEANIPKTYQVYDNLDDPTTIATGVVYKTDTRKPDKVLLTNWGNASGSYWDYDHGEGEDLDDSAVVLYYNPKEITSGGSTSVSTYYGVGIGTTITDSNNGDQIDSNFSLGAGQTAVRVKDLATGEAIENATVTLTKLSDTATIQTDDSGYAVFDNANKFSGACKITVKKDGYKTKDATYTVNLARVVSISLQSENDNRPQIASVTMDGKNLLSENIYFAENVDGVKATSANSTKMTMQVAADQTDCIYQLVQDGVIIQSNTDGKFEFTIINKSAKGKEYTTPRIDGLTAGKLLYINCVSKDGISSGKTRIGLKVKYPSNTSVDTKTSFTLGSKPTLKLNGDKMNPVEKFFFGDGEVSIGADVFPVEVEVNEEGKVTVRVNKNSEMSKEDFDEKIKEANRRISTLKKFGGKSYRFAPAFKFDFGFAGYGEGYLKDGSAIVNVQVMGYIKGSKSWTTQFVLGTFPCYVKTTVEGKLEVTAAANLHNQNGMNFEMTNGAVEPTVTGMIELGAGISGIVSAGVEGSGDIKFNNNLVTGYYRLSSTLQAKFKAKALFFEYNKTIKKYTKVWLDSESESNSAAAEEALFTMQDLYDVNEYQMIDREYLTLSAAGEEALGTSPIEEEIFRSGEFTNAMPKLVQTANGKYYFWLNDDCSRNAANRTALSYSYQANGNNTWSDPVVINDDGTADFYFDVAVAGDEIYVAWQNTNKVFTEEEAKNLTVNDVFAQADIQAAVIDATNNNEVKQLSVTSTDKADILPKIAASGSNVALTWYSTDADKIMAASADASYTIHQSKLGTTGFEESGSIAVTGMITDLDVGYVSGDLVLAYTVDADGDMETSTDRDIYLYKDGQTPQFTNDGENLMVDSAPMFVEEGSNTVLYWYKDGNIAYSTNLVADDVGLIPVTDENNRFSDDFVVLTSPDGTKKKIVWVSFSKYAEVATEEYDMEETKAVYAVDWDGEKWSNAYQMEEIGEGNIMSLSGILDASGKETLAYQRLTYVENYDDNSGDDYVYDNVSELISSDLCLASSVPRKEVSLDDVSFDADLIEPGHPATFTLTLTNHGNESVSKVNVHIGNTQEPVDVNLPVGTTVTVDVEYNVPTDLDEVMDLDIQVEVPETDTTEEALSQADKLQSIQIGYTEISVEEQERTIIDGVEYVVLSIKNNSKIAAREVNLKLMADDEEEGQVVFDTFFDILAGGEEKVVYCPIDALADCMVVYARLTTDTQEDYTKNNRAVIATNNEIADTSITVNISVKSDNAEAGTVRYELDGETIIAEDLQITKSGAEIPLTATPNEGYVFAGWKVEVSGENANQGAFADKNAKSTTYTMPRNDVVITAKFKLASELNNATAIVDDNINTNEQINLLIGEEKQLSPSLTVEGDTAEYIVFASSDENVVTVDKDGLVVAENPGMATVTAKVMKRGDEDTETKLSLTYTFKVNNIALTELRLPKSQEELAGIGTEYNLGGQLAKMPSNATEDIIWSSSDGNVVTVDENGLLTTVNGGTAVITAKAKDNENITVTCEVKVVVPVESLTLSETNLSLKKNEQRTLTLSYFPENTTEAVDNIVWMSNDTDVATVEPAEDGLSAKVTSHSAGTCYITASYDDRITVGCIINVKNPITSLSFAQNAITMNRFEERKLELAVLPIDHDEYVSWESSDYDVVSVYNNGTLYARKPGTAIVTAESSNGIKATCTVTVTNTGSIIELPTYSSFETVTVSDWSKLESDYTDASSHQYQDNVDKMWVYTVPNAKALRIHFSDLTDFEDGCDYIRILDKDNRTVADYEYTGDELAGKWIDIEGNTVKLWMNTDSSVTKYGFKVDACTITPIPQPVKPPVKTNISSAQCTVSKQEYTGAAVMPDPVVIVNGTVLRNGTDYTLTFANNVNMGTATVTVTGIGNYEGTIQRNFDIVFGTVKNFKLSKATTTSVKLTWNKVAGAKGYKVYRYNTKKKNVLVKTIKSGNTKSITIKKLKAATAYKFTIVPYRTSDKKTINGSKTVLQTATCSAAPALKAKAGTKKATLTWKKIKGISGYEIQMSMKKKSGFKVVKSLSAKKTKYVQSKLKKGKTYYFKIRTYKTVAKKKVYSGFSKTIKVKVK